MEELIKEDKITTKTGWAKLVKKYENREWFFNLFDQEYNYPRDIFFDYQL